MLARWEHPERGLIVPDVFIPLAEDSGLINELTFALLGRACIDARDWPPEVTLSLNIAPSQLRDPWLASRLLQVITAGGLKPARLVVEITENGLVSDFDAARRIISSLKNAGVQIALDDFGTGYSSLNHLRELQFDRIKIDRSFVQNLEDQDSGRLVKAIISLGESLGMSVTAEGVETQLGMDMLTSFGCSFGQGFLLGRPMPAGATAQRFALPEVAPIAGRTRSRRSI